MSRPADPSEHSMRVITLTAGTGSFHCGTCMRDNTLTRELRRRGHDALLVPLYLPPVLDEESTLDQTPLFFGGVNVYLQQKSGLFRHTPRWLDRWLDSPRLLAAAARRSGMTHPRDLGEVTLSVLQGEEGRQVKELERLTSWLEGERPDVVLLSNGLLIGLARRIRRATSARVVCMLQGEDTYLDSLPAAYRDRCWETFRERSRDADALVAISRYYGEEMARRLERSPAEVEVVHPGIDLSGYEPAAAPPPVPTIGYLARMTAGKGLGALVDAFLLLRESPAAPRARLLVGGSCTAADEDFVNALRERIAAAGLSGDVEFRPNLSREEKIALLRELTLFSVPATYGESFGLFVLEALVMGVPVVQPEHAAFPEIIGETGGGLLVPPGDPEALARAWEELLLDPDRARSLGRRGRAAVQQRFSMEAMADRTLALLSRVAGGSARAAPDVGTVTGAV